ncbi:hypothetical protein [Thiomicrorhabdus lithotrophica]|uniref:Uncharacterized protein n=1 Tax=Thiomicrorhabdus lithotrophica TaxID=2949997 RepID=A0ABY8CBG1_9GAMM|nr:hypothetical protein [Thiomicrorhabdus lithotrophica]WEJ63314.1 hypothetical protein NR989_03415 [Thiomicrorhabdus lithotrophica]
MFSIKFNLIWFYWAITDILLIVGVTIDPQFLYWAIAFNIIQVFHFYWLTPQVNNFAVQVRIAYLLLLIVALYPPLFFIFYLQIIGTTAMVLGNYCFLARLMSLMPWNNTKDFSLDLIKETFFSKPVNGSVQHSIKKPS